MKRLIMILLGVVTVVLLSRTALAIHQIDKLYLEPNENSTVTWVLPECIKVYVLDYQDSWVLLRITWDIRILTWSNVGSAEGWVPIKKGDI